MTTSSDLGKLPYWVECSLQGVAFWIGHRRCLYRDHPLSEGALAAEICNLIHANLCDNYVLTCEKMYANLLPKKAKPDPKILIKRARADLVISEKTGQADGDRVAKFIIEVKRNSAPMKHINADLCRLAEVRRVHRNVRAFLFVVSQAQRPKRFVDSRGKSIRGKKTIPNSAGYYRVRRTCKAAHGFSSVASAQYACLVEVYA